MFLRKVLFLVKNDVVNKKQFKSLCKSFEPVLCVNLKNYSDEANQKSKEQSKEQQKEETSIDAKPEEPPAEVEVMMKVCKKEGEKSTKYEIRSIPGSLAALGVAPHWRQSDVSLFYVDLNAGQLLRYDFCKRKIFRAQIQCATSSTFVIPVENEKCHFIVGNKRGVDLIVWNGEADKACRFKTLFTVQDGEKFAGNRFNNGKCDENGRLFAGTMFADGNEFEQRLGELYMYDGKDVKTMLCNLGISNGIAWNKEGDKFYFIDTADYNVKEYKYSKESGCICFPKVVYDFKKTDVPQHMIIPDGMTIDTDGNIYVAASNSGTIYKIDPNAGEVLLEIKLPCKQVTSCAFGGPGMDTLYVTTSSQFEQSPPAGMLFEVIGLGATGLPMNQFKLNENDC